MDYVDVVKNKRVHVVHAIPISILYSVLRFL
jgi:hypothetical protein